MLPPSSLPPTTPFDTSRSFLDDPISTSARRVKPSEYVNTYSLFPSLSDDLLVLRPFDVHPYILVEGFPLLPLPFPPSAPVS